MIPKKIHFCWLSGEPYPPLIEHCIESWKQHMPDYELVLWDRAKIDIDQIPWVKEAFDNKRYAFAADYIRLYAVYTEGGIYLDSDVEVFSNFDKFLEHDSFIGLETGGDFEPAIIGAKQGCSWVGQCLEYYRDKHFVQPDGTFDTRPLPTIVGQVMSTHYRIAPLDDQQIHQYPTIGLTVYPCSYFSPKSIHTKKINKTQHTISVHHFDGAWLVKDWKHTLKLFVHRVIIFFVGHKAHNKLTYMLFRRNGEV